MNSAILMDRVFDVYKKTFSIQMLFSIIVGFVSLIAIFVITIGLVAVIAFSYLGSTSVNNSYIIAVTVLAFIILLPLAMAWMYLSSSGHILISKQAFYGERIDLPFPEVFKVLLRVMSAALMQILLFLPWIALIIGFIIAIAGGYAVLDTLGTQLFNPVIAPVTIILVSIAIGIAFVVYSNIFALSIPVAIFEKRIFWGTISRSFALLKGDFWRILGLRLLWFVLVYIFTYSAQGLIMVVFAIAMAIGGNLPSGDALGVVWMATSTLQTLFSLVVGVLVAPLEGILTALIYFNQKIKKDGLDIEIGIEQLGREVLP